MSVALRFLQTCHGCYGGLGRPPGAAAWGGCYGGGGRIATVVAARGGSLGRWPGAAVWGGGPGRPPGAAAWGGGLGRRPGPHAGPHAHPGGTGHEIRSSRAEERAERSRPPLALGPSLSSIARRISRPPRPTHTADTQRTLPCFIKVAVRAALELLLAQPLHRLQFHRMLRLTQTIFGHGAHVGWMG